MIVLVPAYQPDHRLPALVRGLLDADARLGVVVVDDGSGPAYAATFAEVRRLGAQVLGWPVNRGKGAALRAGVAHVRRAHPGEDVVCADCDGQHRVPDVLAVADAVRASGAAVVLGARRFTGRVPLRSRWGNAVTRAVYGLVAGLPVQDTQTGLRGYPASVLGWLEQVPGDRFEYELEVLLRAAREGRDVREVAIDTVYLDGNASSHFRPLVDSARIYLPFVRFCAASLASAVVDTAALVALQGLTGALVPSAVLARAVSATTGYLLNRRVVVTHGGRRPPARSAARYAALAAVLLGANVTMLAGLTGAGVPLLAAKLLTDGSLLVVGFAAQRRYVFRGGRVDGAPARPRPARRTRARSARDAPARPPATGLDLRARTGPPTVGG